MKALSPTEPQADKVHFDMWHASRKICIAHRTADGYIAWLIAASAMTGFLKRPNQKE
jgi:hypothetical protein